MSSKHPDLSQKRHDLVQSFDALALSGGKRESKVQIGDKVPKHKVPTKDGGFVGGFSPGLNFFGGGSAYPTPNGWKPSAFRRASGNDGTSRPFSGGIPSPGSLPRPPAFVPMLDGPQQSLTMQHALGTLPRPGLMPPGPQTPPSRPQSTSVLPPPSYPSSSLSIADSGSKPAEKLTPSRRRATSEPPSPSTPSKNGTVQCSGVTKAGKQCTRQVKCGSALSTLNPNEQMDRFCYQHTKELLAVVGFYSHKVANEYIKFQGSLRDICHYVHINLTGSRPN